MSGKDTDFDQNFTQTQISQKFDFLSPRAQVMAQLVFLANFGQKLTKITQNDQKSLEIILIDKYTHFEPNFTPNQSF